jgi:hypothetical protein
VKLARAVGDISIQNAPSDVALDEHDGIADRGGDHAE